MNCAAIHTVHIQRKAVAMTRELTIETYEEKLRKMEIVQYSLNTRRGVTFRTAMGKKPRETTVQLPLASFSLDEATQKFSTPQLRMNHYGTPPLKPFPTIHFQ